MSSIGICEYVTGIICDKDVLYYVGEYDRSSKKLKPREKYSSFLTCTKRYDDLDLLRDDLDLLHASVTRKILEIQCCPKCGKEFTEYPALSRENNKTEICPKCGMEEALARLSEYSKKSMH